MVQKMCCRTIKFNNELAEEALVVFRRHGWYLTLKVVLFSLFSDSVSQDEKSRISSRLLTFKPDAPESYKLEKPKFPTINENTELVDLVPPLSFKFFRILNTDSDWLPKDPKDWKADPSYTIAKVFV